VYQNVDQFECINYGVWITLKEPCGHKSLCKELMVARVCESNLWSQDFVQRTYGRRGKGKALLDPLCAASQIGTI
jgi:hypothetical protein